MLTALVAGVGPPGAGRRGHGGTASITSRTRDLAARIIRHAPEMVAACLRPAARGLNLPIDEALAVEAAQFAATVPTDAVRAGIQSFLSRAGIAS